MAGAIFKKQGYQVEDGAENTEEQGGRNLKEVVLTMNSQNKIEYENMPRSELLNTPENESNTSIGQNTSRAKENVHNNDIEEPVNEGNIELDYENLSTAPRVRPDIPKTEKPKSLRNHQKTKAKLSPHPSTDSEKGKESVNGASDKPILIHNSSEETAVAGITNIPPKSPSPRKTGPTTEEQSSEDVIASSTEVPPRLPRPSARKQDTNEVKQTNEVRETRAHLPKSPRPSQRKQETSDISEAKGPLPNSRQPSQRKQKSNDGETGATVSKPPIPFPRKQQSKEVEEDKTPLGKSDMVKNDDLPRQVEELAGNKELLQNEYADIVDFVKQNIKKPRNVAKEEKHKAHNRYTDIGKPSQNYK